MANSDDSVKNKAYMERVQQAKVVRRIVFFSVSLITLLILVIGGTGYFYVKSALGPIDKSSTEVVDVHIPIGSSSGKIGSILEAEGLIKSGTFFRYYVRYKNETGFQAGDYQLTKAMSLLEIIKELKQGTVLQEPELSFTIPEGLWVEDVIAIIAEHTDHEQSDIKQVIQDEAYLETLITRYPILTEEILQTDIKYPLEGYLFPARYDFLEADVSVEEMIEKMIERTEDVVSKLEHELDNHERSIHEIMTLASIIEKEAQKPEDRYLISGVLFNRLDLGMRLQVDPTVAYAIGEHRYMTTFADLEVDSPYNTYRYAGIPIGPIANPGEAAIEAALRPGETDDLYFYARRDGEVLYNKTYEEHNRVHQKYKQEWIDGSGS